MSNDRCPICGGEDGDHGQLVSTGQWCPNAESAAGSGGTSDSNDVAVEDVRAIAVALGLGGHARPHSAHDVVQREILPAIAAVREFAVEMINAPDDSAADWGYDLAHRLGMWGAP